jgi:hypothetical protein
MKRIRHEFPMKDPSRNITLRKDRRFLGKFETFERLDDLHVPGPVWLVDPLEFALDEDRNVGAVFRKFVFEPTYSQIAAERIAGVKIGSDDRCFEIQA